MKNGSKDNKDKDEIEEDYGEEKIDDILPLKSSRSNKSKQTNDFKSNPNNSNK